MPRRSKFWLHVYIVSFFDVTMSSTPEVTLVVARYFSRFHFVRYLIISLSRKISVGSNVCHDVSNHRYLDYWGLVCQKQASRARTNDYIPHYVWDVITCPCPRYLLLVRKATIEEPFSLSTFPLAGWQRLNQLRRSVDNRAWAPNPLSSGIVVIDTKARVTKATTSDIVHYSVQWSPSIPRWPIPSWPRNVLFIITTVSMFILQWQYVL